MNCAKDGFFNNLAGGELFPRRYPPGLNRGVINTYAGCIMENCIIVDWLTFTSKEDSYRSIVDFLGLAGCNWVPGKGSRLHYAKTYVFGGITIHYTPDNLNEKKWNAGVCVEMSGQGCRDFETFSEVGFTYLFQYVCTLQLASLGSVTRIDLAFDDFTGCIPLDTMEEYAKNFWFVSRLSNLSVEMSAKVLDPQYLGVNIYHGSRGSNVSFRFYDKRVERGRFDLDHWVRAEIQLRQGAAYGFLQNFYNPNVSDSDSVSCPDNLGELFASIVRQYLDYKEPSDQDTNKSRWPTAVWWSGFLGEVEPISLFSKKDREYNKSRMERYAYQQNHNHTKSLIEIDGLGHYLTELHQHREQIPDKYKAVATAADNSDEILRRLNELPTESTEDYLKRCRSSIDSELSRLAGERVALNLDYLGFEDIS